jgi:hypothetical protein
MYMTNSTKPKHSIIRVQGCKAILPRCCDGVLGEDDATRDKREVEAEQARRWVCFLIWPERSSRQTVLL